MSKWSREMVDLDTFIEDQQGYHGIKISKKGLRQACGVSSGSDRVPKIQADDYVRRLCLERDRVEKCEMLLGHSDNPMGRQIIELNPRPEGGCMVEVSTTGFSWPQMREVEGRQVGTGFACVKMRCVGDKRWQLISCNVACNGELTQENLARHFERAARDLNGVFWEARLNKRDDR